MSTIREEFNVHLLNAEGIRAARAVAEIFSDTLTQLEALGLTGREKALVVTGLQQAGFWAKRAIAVLPQHQAEPTGEFTGQNAR
jgi:hypothetical protein